MSDPQTIAGTKVFISKKPVRGKANVTLADFANAEWVEIGGLLTLGDLGSEQAITEVELINEEWTRKSKGGRNGGTMSNVFIPDARDEGQAIFKAAIEDCRPYRFKVERGASCSPESEVTISVADPAVITWDDHGLTGGDVVMFTTDGTLPTGITAGVVYYVLDSGLTANTFQVSATDGGTPVDTTAAGTGVHTATAPPLGMTDLFFGYATDGTRTGGDKAATFSVTWPIAVTGAIITV